MNGNMLLLLRVVISVEMEEVAFGSIPHGQKRVIISLGEKD
jgi:hypothetical protein